MLPLRLLLRAARRLHKAARGWIMARNPDQELRRLEQCQRAVQRAGRRLDKARGRSLALIDPRLRDDLLGHLKAVHEAAGQARQILEQPPSDVPDAAGLAAELKQLEAEFDSLRIDWKERSLAVTTEAITLEGVPLGAFVIQLFWERLSRHVDVQCFDVTAVDPNPAAVNDQVTHPHVRGRELCAGDAALPLRQALRQGRLADAFCLIRSVLTHYNADSPYVSLDQWEGVACEDCGRAVGDDDRCYCEACSCDYCWECTGSCTACGDARCRGCLTRCTVCAESCCGRCLRSCARSGKECCSHCLQPCVSCGAKVARDELAAETDRCPSCRPPEQAQGAGPLPAAGAPDTTLGSPSLEIDHANAPECVHAPAG